MFTPQICNDNQCHMVSLQERLLSVAVHETLTFFFSEILWMVRVTIGRQSHTQLSGKRGAAPADCPRAGLCPAVLISEKLRPERAIAKWRNVPRALAPSLLKGLRSRAQGNAHSHENTQQDGNQIAREEHTSRGPQSQTSNKHFQPRLPTNTPPEPQPQPCRKPFQTGSPSPLLDCASDFRVTYAS